MATSYFSAFCIALLVGFFQSSASASASVLPSEAFSHLPIAQNVRLSPDGKYIMYLLNRGPNTFLVSNELATKKMRFLVKTDNEKFKIRWVKWVNNKDILLSAIFPYRRYGTKTTETRLLSIPADLSSDLRQLIKPKMRSNGTMQHNPQFQDQILSMIPSESEDVLIELDLEMPTSPGVYKLNVKTGTKKRLIRGRENIRDWVVDSEQRLRVGMGYDSQENKYFMRVKDLETGKWNTLWRKEPFSPDIITPLGFGLDNDKLYIRKLFDGREAIFAMDLSKKDFPLELVASDPVYDIEGDLNYSRKTNDVIGVYHHASDGKVIYWDKDYRDFQDAIDTVLPDTANTIVSMSEDERRYVVFSSSSTQPGVYYFGDRDVKTLSPFINNYPLLEESILSGKKEISYKARDGVEIEGYLTLPKNFSGKSVPAIIFPHGGPMARDYNDFDYWAEFFSHRGYAVLQPNFRGSSGYGADFSAAAIGGFGLEMQDDLTDGASWLIEEGIADRNRMCIVGASYGGYAALMATVKTPNLFKCAVSFAGFGDLVDLRNQYRKFVNRKIVKEQIGGDSKALRRRSPINMIGKIKTPILLIHGEDDRVVSVEQSRDMASKLKRKKKKYKYVELEDGNHYLNKQEHRFTLFTEMDAFLAKYLQ